MLPVGPGEFCSSSPRSSSRIIDSDAYSSINGDGLVLLDHLREEKRITDQQHDVLWNIVDKANALAERVVALEAWVLKGGHLPAQWARREP